MGGVIFCIDEEIEMLFARGLGMSTNNQEKFLDLWQGLEIAIARWIQHLIVFDGSMIVIQQIHKIKEISENDLSPLILRINLQI